MGAKPRNIALIVAAGRGHRVGGPLPKQYRKLCGRSILSHSVLAFAAHPAVSAVRVVIHPSDEALYQDALSTLDTNKLLSPVNGGATRQDSVRLGLESLAEDAPDAVLIHDGARPLVSGAVIARSLEALQENIGAIAALPLSDSLKRATPDGKMIDNDVARDGLWRAQTPQTFRFADILAAHRAAEGQNATDDAGVAERHGIAVALVAGDEENIKITTEADMTRAEQILHDRSGGAPAGEQTWRVKVGLGYDVHRFAEDGDHLMLCAVRVPFERGVASHSDGDVALHALVDAILGALGDGDIGVHFPPSDEKWRDAKSEIFVAHALKLLTARQGQLDHIDITLICERPKLSPYRDEMRGRLASLLGLPLSDISLKATTTERLGFTGRAEGIAAQAVATLRLPVTP
ncbi:MAG: bifunctional 2-C-methyl-D-erythritol 4-phosphate cytidylyltransferase/2-C-methyl-D-erythritol 2,4-cyclodiphosphate synthase [Rhodospirillaceae bacterium]|nr:bifunctional 2-C-methyl-D-erythritol 4-phosphate cytidylyltransferase/2-C-methyl-D-erythritol 2,4-cyclodiphosphate synthase [Rhodospirillaceae bacterium]MBT5038696.1 bifunctional 2-C-methyl-D-erythritol 4-phosphate cytidylyltransferase/2-C-methyl-D-erythritol 2,4-cyclodiphosphate synthase [Rhodospirillaceae bacterium]MBT5677763.1 bifunctional 2-C-methyl-D-erythritol 4-phosphate cytidylyltransferase/2-C-methyl-D-erythritol 2,4-cyclodiphosphate synthase [Rhodospirillaceae bacterium]MBT5780205.1